LRVWHPSTEQHIQLNEPKDEIECRSRYGLSVDEITLVEEHAREFNRSLAFLVLLKTFQNTGYFCDLQNVPVQIINYIREQLLNNGPDEVKRVERRLPERSKPTLYEYRKVIREYRGVKAYSGITSKQLTTELTRAAQTMNSTADLINVAVEWLIKERWELPTFSTLDRMAGHIKQSVNEALFDQVYDAMSGEQKIICTMSSRKILIAKTLIAIFT
jgi:hypothetical protein